MIQLMVESLKQVEERVKDIEGPLPILKEIHEYYMAETAMCDFPKLAQEFFQTYKVLLDVITSFEISLQEIG